ncbi:MAG: LytTR family DNA-binding domain-containing protein [Bacteroidota bacterium]
MSAARQIRVVVIDDEAGARNSLVQLLARDFPAVELVGMASGVASGKALIERTQPDGVLLDIQMGDGTGFDLLDVLSGPLPAVIFTTAFDHFAVRAFRYFALDYLLKPVDPVLLGEALDKLPRAHPLTSDRVVAALEAIEKQELTRIAVPDAEGMTFVRIDGIVHCRADKNYTELHLRDGRCVTASRTLKHFEGLLPPEVFFRVHQSHLVNLRLVARFERQDGGVVQMEDGTQIPVSRRRREQLLQRLSAM